MAIFLVASYEFRRLLVTSSSLEEPKNSIVAIFEHLEHTSLVCLFDFLLTEFLNLCAQASGEGVLVNREDSE